MLAGIAVLLLGLSLAIAHFGAVRAQRGYQHLVHLMAEPGVYRAVERQYRRGWVSSQAVTELDINSRWLKSALGIDTGGHPLTLLLDHHIQHGPLLFPQSGGLAFGVALISTQLDMSSPAMRQLRNWFPDGVPFSAETRVDFTGATDTEVRVPRGALPPGFDGNHERIGINWDGFTGFLITSPNLTHYEAAADSGGIQLSGPFGHLQVLSATATGEGDLAPNGHWETNQRVSLQRLLARKPQDTFSNGLDIESTHIVTSNVSSPDADHTSSHWRLRDVRIGPMRIHSLNASVRATYWNNSMLEWLARLVLGTASAPGAKGSSPAMPTPAGRSVISVRNLRINTHNGTAEGHFKLVYDAPRGAKSRGMLSSISGHGTLTAPATLVRFLVERYVQRRLAAQAAVDPSAPTDPAAVAQKVTARHISKLLHEGALQREGSHLTSTLRVDDGKVTAAGVPVTKLLPETPAN